MEEKILNILGNSMVQKWLSKLFGGYVNTYKKEMILFKSTWIFGRERRVKRLFFRSLYGMVSKICLFVIFSILLFGLLTAEEHSVIKSFRALIQNGGYGILCEMAAVILLVAAVVMSILNGNKLIKDRCSFKSILSGWTNRST